MRSKIANTPFSDVSTFAEEIFNIFDVIQSVDKVNTSCPKQRFEQYLEKIRKFKELDSKLSSRPSKAHHIATLGKLKEKPDEIKNSGECIFR